MSATASPRSGAVVEVPAETARAVCGAALAAAGAPAPTARRVARALVRNDQRGLPSHGLLRLGDYLGEIAAGSLDVAATPATTAPSPQVRRIDGRRCFGVLAADAVADTLTALLADHALAAVSLVGANHLGALRDVGDAVAGRGGIVIGFVNYLGAGQRVPPPQASPGRLCTNPVLIAIPGGSGPPFVLDISTSTVSEGAIRARHLAGEPVPDGWLVDAGWKPVEDPAGLYADPPTAFMTPLGGGTAGHKGFGLGLAVELLAGVIAGAGAVGPEAAVGGNGGLFLGIRPTATGRSPEELEAEVDALRRHTTFAAGDGTSVDGAPVRWPGDRPAPSGEETVRVGRTVWDAVQRAAGEAER